jgi:hypothetical protein
VSTPFCVETVRTWLVSTVSCTASTEPVRTVYWFGIRMVREGPILPEGAAPELANWSSYCLLMLPMKFSLACRMRSASRVMIVGDRRVCHLGLLRAPVSPYLKLLVALPHPFFRGKTFVARVKGPRMVSA